MSSLLAYRPVHALHRLPPGSEACPLSLRHVLAAPGLPRAPVLGVLAATEPVLRGALAAAREARAVVVLRCPRGADAERWFALAAGVAADFGPGHPFVAAAEVAVTDPERAAGAVAALVDAGIGHVVLDATALPAAERADALGPAAGLASERELGVELVLDPEEALRPDRAAASVAALRLRGVEVDLARAEFLAPASDADARAQARALALLARQAGAGISRGGATTPGLLQLLAASPLRACDDGGAVHEAALRAGGDLACAEALAWAAASRLLESLGAPGSARGLAARFAGEA